MAATAAGAPRAAFADATPAIMVDIQAKVCTHLSLALVTK